MNTANALTLSRIPILLLLVGILLLDPVYGGTAAFLLYGIGGLTDWADGWVARRFDQVTDFGKLMDALTDKIFTIGLFIVCLHFGYMPDWTLLLLLLILTREFLITGMRLVAASRNVVLAAEKSGKVKTVFQMLAIGLFLLAPALAADWNVPVGGVQAIRDAGSLFFLGASGLTIISGWIYLRKYGYLFASGGPGRERPTGEGCDSD